MIDRAAALAAVTQQVRVGDHALAWIDLIDHVGAQRRRLQNLAQDLQAFDVRGAVDLGPEIIDPDLGRLRRICAADAQRAAAFRPQLADRGAEGRIVVQLLAHLVGAERQEVHLDIRARQSRIGLEERAGRSRGDGQRPGAKRRIAQPGQDPADRAVDDVVERDGLRAAHHDPHLQMILQVGADTRRVQHHVDAVLPQQRGRADTG